MSIFHIAAYRFVALRAPAALVAPLRARCEALDLKGTIIVAAEGINLSLAGAAASIDGFLGWLAADPLFVDADGSAAFAGLDVTRSASATRPFARLKVRHKDEIVTMRRPAIRPAAGRAPTVAPERLAAWLSQGHDDEGRPVVLLDTRNAFEVGFGSFGGALDLGLARFEAFPDAVGALRTALADRTVVTYCTGGIRCEKAALYMRAAGFERVMQLEGGILDYFDRVGDAHWRGACFVFDERVAVRSARTGR